MNRTDPLDAAIGACIRALRLQRGLTQNEFGARVGVSAADVELFEIGARRVGAARLLRIAKVFNVDVGALFGGGGASPQTAKSPDVPCWPAEASWHSPPHSIH